MIIYNDIVKILNNTLDEYQKKYHKKVYLISTKDDFIFNIYTNELNSKIENYYKDKKVYEESVDLKILLEEFLKYYDTEPISIFEKVNISDDSILKTKLYEKLESFLSVNKKMFFIAYWIAKNEKDLNKFNQIFNNEELKEIYVLKKEFFNILVSNIIDYSNNNDEYSSIQCRIQDSYYLYELLNKEVFSKYIDYNTKLFYSKVDIRTIYCSWQTKGATLNKYGVDWLSVHNVLMNISKMMFINISKDLELRESINTKLDNLEIVFKKWEKFKNILNYNILDQFKKELFLKINNLEKAIKLTNITNITNKESEIQECKLIKNRIEALFGIDNFYAVNKQTLSLSYPLDKFAYLLNMEQKNEVLVVVGWINKIINVYLISDEYNPNGVITACDFSETETGDIENKKVKNIVFKIKYSDEIGEYVLKRLGDVFEEMIFKIGKMCIGQYQDDIETYLPEFKKFIQNANALILDNKIIVNSLDIYNKEKRIVKKKI